MDDYDNYGAKSPNDLSRVDSYERDAYPPRERDGYRERRRSPGTSARRMPMLAYQQHQSLL